MTGTRILYLVFGEENGKALKECFLLTLYMLCRGYGITLTTEAISRILPLLRRKCGSA
jgi:hypothetical protein